VLREAPQVTIASDHFPLLIEFSDADISPVL
jgi:endonuclease/exonuclease/phosphatase (EEP) superfamily protein YafD